MKKYLALGDSYTIGELVPEEESFPFQLVKLLNKQGCDFMLPKIIATTGWTSDELIKSIDKANVVENFDLVTLLIGVNNQYRKYSKDIFRDEFKFLLEKSISFANGDIHKVKVISIPDWGCTPEGINSGRGIEVIGFEIDEFNEICKEEATNLGVSYYDITPISRNVHNDLSWIAEDGLHPSGKMYKAWADLIFENIKQQYN